MKPTANEIGPWDFEPGTPAWAAAMLEFQEKRKSSEVHVHITNDGEERECERCKRRIPRGPNDLSVQIIHVGGDAAYVSEKEARESREAAAPLSEAPPLAQQQRKGPPANSEPDEGLAEEAREERLNAYIAARTRRPSVHKSSFRRYQWPPSAYGL